MTFLKAPGKRLYLVDVALKRDVREFSEGNFSLYVTGNETSPLLRTPRVFVLPRRNGVDYLS